MKTLVNYYKQKIFNKYKIIVKKIYSKSQKKLIDANIAKNNMEDTIFIYNICLNFIKYKKNNKFSLIKKMLVKYQFKILNHYKLKQILKIIVNIQYKNIYNNINKHSLLKILVKFQFNKKILKKLVKFYFNKKILKKLVKFQFNI